ncbi:secondary thiamine-phosphate synthase enzyme YjbQ [Siccirubricoccus phaeus]|uniref:secondary thiamine-phosphate synthase enzyme YjbQ n=1 Tax=Siccirubricoccus phaeus TaxID=2595053 RepID=UPI0011F14B6D|nr:secondary thiamine-phosphate synthase enzyme YjbQ [Siccirubricoccus phaeus]
MRQALHRLEVATWGRGLTDITAPVCRFVAEQGIGTGLLTLWCRHTSASLLVQENASPDVQVDLEAFLARLVPDGGAERYRHAEEGPDDMPAHIRSMLTATQLSVPVTAGRPVLGTWQAIYLYEHRTSPHRREVVLHLLGEAG